MVAKIVRNDPDVVSSLYADEKNDLRVEGEGGLPAPEADFSSFRTFECARPNPFECESPVKVTASKTRGVVCIF